MQNTGALPFLSPLLPVCGCLSDRKWLTPTEKTSLMCIHLEYTHNRKSKPVFRVSFRSNEEGTRLLLRHDSSVRGREVGSSILWNSRGSPTRPFQTQKAATKTTVPDAHFPKPRAQHPARTCGVLYASLNLASKHQQDSLSSFLARQHKV